jgi:nucleotide-binding universal stress UspA family protein
MGPVVIAYDGSEFAKTAIEQAGRELKTERKALVLTVWQPLASLPFVAGPSGQVPTDVVEGIERSASTVAAEGADLASAAGFEAEPVTVEGDPVWRKILDVADENDAAVIVCGSHGRTGFDYIAIGSVATAVAQHAGRPVMIAKTASA